MSNAKLVPAVLPLLKIFFKKHVRLGHAGIMGHSVDLSIRDSKKKSILKGMDPSNKKLTCYINA